MPPEETSIGTAPHHGESGNARQCSVRGDVSRFGRTLRARLVVVIDERDDSASGERIHRALAQVVVAACPSRSVMKRGREKGDGVAAIRVIANVEQKPAQARQFAIRKLGQHRGVLPPVHDENAEIERLEG